MDSWFYKNLGDAMLAHEPLGRIEAAFRSAYRDTRHSGEVAVFIRHVSAGHLHCQVEVFFSPACALIADRFSAAPCARPSTGDLGLLVGSEESWSTLFRDG